MQTHDLNKWRNIIDLMSLICSLQGKLKMGNGKTFFLYVHRAIMTSLPINEFASQSAKEWLPLLKHLQNIHNTILATVCLTFFQMLFTMSV